MPKKLELQQDPLMKQLGKILDNEKNKKFSCQALRRSEEVARAKAEEAEQKAEEIEGSDRYKECQTVLGLLWHDHPFSGNSFLCRDLTEAARKLRKEAQAFREEAIEYKGEAEECEFHESAERLLKEYLPDTSD